MDVPSVEKTAEDSFDWRQFYDDIDLRVIGTYSKGSNGCLSLAVLSGNGSHLYAFMRETQDGDLEDSTRHDDA